MRILVVGAIQGGTIPIGNAIYRAFMDIGQETEFLDFSGYQQEFLEVRPDAGRSRQFLLKIWSTLLEKVTVFQPDVILGIAQSPLYNTEMLAAFRKAGIILCFWFMEDYKIFDYWKNIAPCFDHFFTIQKDPFFSDLRDAGCKSYHYLPMAFDTHTDRSETRTRELIPVSFVGAPYSNRVHFFSQFHIKGFQIYGEGWHRHGIPSVIIGDRRITAHEAQNIYQSSLININLHSSPIPRDFVGGDFVNPRTFDIAGLGAFQLTNMRKLLPLHFDPAQEIIALSNWEDMKSAIMYFLDHDSEREEIARNAQRRVMREHTYRHRAEEIVSLL